MNERELFEQAMQIDDLDERRRFLASACGSDESLRARMDELITAAVRDDSFLNLPEDQANTTELWETALGTSIGPYKLLEKIGEGGFGVVYMAEQQQPVRRTVAIKVIKPGMDSRQVIARFEAERQALAIMDHPHIAKVLDAGTTPSGLPFFVMELVKGISITTYCDQHRLSLSGRLELFVSVCQAIQHAHSKGVIHRDIKPGNVLVAAYDGRPVVKVIDFGIAKATGQQLTESTLHTAFGAVVGSFEYMSPEQASFNQLDIDTRSDVYSLGVLLYELLTGDPPLTADDLKRIGFLESLRSIREHEPLRPSMRVSTADGLPSLAANRSTEPARLTALLRGDLDWVVMKAISKNRDRRYETVNGLADEIERVLTGAPVQAHPPSVLYQLKKWSWKRRWSISASIAVLLIIIVGSLSMIRINHQRAQQVGQRSMRVSKAIDDATQKLGTAIGAPIGSQGEWVAARDAQDRVQQLLEDGVVHEEVASRAREYLETFAQFNADRDLAEQIENVVITSATHEDLPSWLRMEQQFHDMFATYGIDFDTQTPNEIARRIRNHRSAEQLCDALELWIGTKGQLGMLGGPPATRATMQPWADALLAADDNPVRNGIRLLIYSGQRPSIAQVDQVVEGIDLSTLSPRTLSWLATTYAMAGGVEQSDEVFALATLRHPSDMMLNFDYAYTLVNHARWPLAIRYYLRCVALRPTASGPWRGLGNAYRENEELQASRDCLEQAIRLEPDYGPIYVDLARTLRMLGDHEGAFLAADEAVERGHETLDSKLEKGLSLAKLGRFAEALVIANECLKATEEGSSAEAAFRELKETCQRELSEAPSSTDK